MSKYRIVRADKHSWDLRDAETGALLARGSEEEMHDLLRQMEAKDVEPLEFDLKPRKRRAWWQMYGRGKL